MKFCPSVFALVRSQNLCQTQTDRPTERHFVKIVKSSSKHRKTCKSVKNQKSKISTISLLSSYVKYRKEQNWCYRKWNSFKDTGGVNSATVKDFMNTDKNINTCEWLTKEVIVKVFLSWSSYVDFKEDDEAIISPLIVK